MRMLSGRDKAERDAKRPSPLEWVGLIAVGYAALALGMWTGSVLD